MNMKRIMTVILMFLVLMTAVPGMAEKQVWVLCQPDSQVNIRSRASGRSEIVGYAMAGDEFRTDGKTKAGFLHVIAPVEAGEGWISLGYLVWEQPEYVGEMIPVGGTGRVNARKTVNGKRRCWVQPGEEIMVYWVAEWAVTDHGFIKAEFIGE